MAKRPRIHHVLSDVISAIDSDVASAKEPRPAKRAAKTGRAPTGAAHGVLLSLEAPSTTRRLFELDPNKCRLWKRHKRITKFLNERDCADLLESIRAQGQKEPAVVRRLDNDPDGYEFEVIAGARRHWCAKHLGQRLLARVVDVDEEDAFRISLASNTTNPPSPYEQALEVAEALEVVFDGNQRRLAQATGLSETRVSRLVTFASVPREVIEVLPDPRELSLRTGVRLAQACQGPNGKVIVERARRARRDNLTFPSLNRALRYLLTGDADDSGGGSRQIVAFSYRGYNVALRRGKRGLVLTLPPRVAAEDLRVIFDRVLEVVERAGHQVAGDT